MITKMITVMLISTGITMSYRNIKLDVLSAFLYHFNIKLGLTLKNVFKEAWGCLMREPVIILY
jgi:hypothetical protein